MKTEKQVREKIKEHEDKITELLNELNDISVELIDSYIRGRKVLLWVLSDEDLITPDEFEKSAKYDCMCYDSSKIF